LVILLLIIVLRASFLCIKNAKSGHFIMKCYIVYYLFAMILTLLCTHILKHIINLYWKKVSTFFSLKSN